ncbi:MAG TPA: NADAR family protein [Kofleriaceae bacterium]|nr:NADAR family protein [Kofleriaceae bacterium]
MDLPLDLAALRAAVAGGRSFGYRLFYGHRARDDGQLSDSVFSQWWPCRFAEGGQLYTSAEQFMMAGKARLFGDGDRLADIAATDDPAACKALGRRVAGFDEARWQGARFDLVTRGSAAKFRGEPLRAYLLATGEDILVEASPRDRIWGIGLGRASEAARDPRTWRGQNLLGFALVRARAILRGELPLPDAQV